MQAQKKFLYPALLGAILAGAVLYVIFPFIDVLIGTVFVYYVGRPIHRRLAPRLKSETFSSIISICILALPLLLIVSYVILIIVQQFPKFMEGLDLTFLREVRGIGSNLSLSRVLEVFSGSSGSSFTSMVLSLGKEFMMFIFKLFLIAILSVYLVRDGGLLRQYMQKFFFRDDEIFIKFLDAVDEDIAEIFFRNIVLTSLVTSAIGVVTFICLNLVAPSPQSSIPFPILIGVLCGLASFVPLVGMKLVYLPVTAYLFWSVYAAGSLSSDLWFILLFLAVAALVVDLLPDNILRPFMGGKKHIHKALLLCAFIFGTLVLGLKGLFLGPVLLALVVNYCEVYLPKVMSSERI